MEISYKEIPFEGDSVPSAKPLFAPREPSMQMMAYGRTGAMSDKWSNENKQIHN